MPELAELGWGSDDPAFRQVFTARFMPGAPKPLWDEFNELQRRSTSPQTAARFMRATAGIDVSETAARLDVPTLVLHARRDRMPPLEQGRALASAIRGSRFVTLESDNHLLLGHEPAWDRFVAEVAAFLNEG
jgi:pimeloyl-ACP methyl ester carboxylesterase